MANFEIPDNPEFSTVMRRLETTDPAAAELFNAMFERLLNNDAAIIAGTIPVGDAEKTKKIETEKLNTSVLEKALSLTIGMYTFELGRGDYTGNDLPNNQYAYGMATVYKTSATGAIVVLYNQRYGLPVQINQHNGTNWLGWKDSSRRAHV